MTGIGVSGRGGGLIDGEKGVENVGIVMFNDSLLVVMFNVSPEL